MSTIKTITDTHIINAVRTLSKTTAQNMHFSSVPDNLSYLDRNNILRVPLKDDEFTADEDCINVMRSKVLLFSLMLNTPEKAKKHFEGRKCDTVFSYDFDGTFVCADYNSSQPLKHSLYFLIQLTDDELDLINSFVKLMSVKTYFVSQVCIDYYMFIAPIYCFIVDNNTDSE